MKLCFKLNGKLVCPPIYQTLPPWWPIPPEDPRPGDHFRPQAEPSDPSPWRDIHIIAVMDELAKTLSPDRAKSIQAVLRSAIDPKDLPEGVTISF
jgi:hypothetical protein